MSIEVRSTVDVTETRYVTVTVPVDNPDDVGVREVEDAVGPLIPFDHYIVTDYEVVA